MCGRYASSRAPDDLAREFEVERVDVRERLAPEYNVAPTQDVYAVLDRATTRDDPGSGDAPDTPQRRLTVLRWGLVPSWAKDPAIGNKLINARLETAHRKPAFRAAFARRRCLLPADGYYEWYGETKGRKQPFFIRPTDGGVLAMAGLYEIWRDPDRPEDDPDALRRSATVLTTSAPDSVGQIHDRMPLLVEARSYDAWLDPRIEDPETVGELLIPAAPGRLEAYPVSTEVNNVRNHGARLIEPLAPEGGTDALF